MSSRRPPELLRRSGLGLLFAGLAAGAVLTGPPAAWAQASRMAGGALFGPPTGQAGPAWGPPVARYASETGVRFTFDRSQGLPLVKFDRSPEVWVLKPQPAPRGDVLYLNDLGEPILRASRTGGLTVFTSERPEGLAVALSGGGQTLRMTALGPQQLLERLALASTRATRAARRLIPFEADASPSSSALTADAAMVAAEAIIRMTRLPDGRLVLGGVERVRLIEGRQARADLREGVIEITVAPGQGLSGRPSSDRILAAAGLR
ncbi:DUF4908 domain-containing protein [Phenylobacterium sp.]|jgi:hypothetical protein|uniref:DUF4908 domain-containing protein n=1 Tax=Phenylobacterium sp. TaxID=1871053 RepID=UPI0025E4F068|nr:DUF4908 domain-containing protein [Phenylobacterium sp.]